MTPPRALLIRLPNPLGDVVMATPLMRVLRQAWPDTRLICAGAPHYRELLQGLDSFDAFLALPSSGVRDQGRAFRDTGADMALLLPNSWSSALAARLAGIPHRIGRRAQGRGALLTRRLPSVGPARPMTRVYLEMLAALDLPVPTEEQAPAPELALVGDAIDTEPDLLGVAPGAAFGPSKLYPTAQLVDAVRELNEAHSMRVRMIGSPAEAELLQSTTKALAEAGVEVETPPSGNLEQAKRNLAACRALLSMDSGARHMAAALGIPQVVIYGPTHPGWSAHSLERTTILRQDKLDCINCHHKQCPIDHRCMTQIESSRVSAALSQAVLGSEMAKRTPESGVRS